MERSEKIRHPSRRGVILWINLFIGLTLGGMAQAHEKWFFSSEQIQEFSRQARPEVFTSLNPINLSILVAGLIAIGALLVLDLSLRGKQVGRETCRKLLSLKDLLPPAVGITTGVVLIYAGVNCQFFAENLNLLRVHPEWICFPLSYAEVGLGICLILGLYTRLVSLLVLVVYLAAALLFDFREWLDYIDVVGVALFLMILGRGRFSLDEKLDIRFLDLSPYKKYAMPTLRIFVGLDLMVLGINDKLFNPHVAMAVVQKYHLNFMQLLGFTGFSDALFVLGAAAVETSIGLMLVLGIATRLTSVILAGLFATTLVVFGPLELIGHLPLFAVVFALLSMGTGGRWRIQDLFARKWMPEKVKLTVSPW